MTYTVKAKLPGSTVLLTLHEGDDEQAARQVFGLIDRVLLGSLVVAVEKKRGCGYRQAGGVTAPEVKLQGTIEAYEGNGVWWVRFPAIGDRQYANRPEAEAAIKRWFAEQSSDSHINVGRIVWHFRKACPKHGDNCGSGCEWYERIRNGITN